MDATMMKDMTYFISRETNTPLASFDNDAKLCYDRIVILIALLLARRQGLGKGQAKWIAKTTRFVQKFIQTGYGVSD